MRDSCTAFRLLARPAATLAGLVVAAATLLGAPATARAELRLAAAAENRLALVVGNSSYENVTALDNAAADAERIASALETAGFQVTKLLNAGQAEMNLAIARFGRSLRDGGADTVGLFYYAGHGVQSFGTNYLLPVDVTLTDAADLPLVGVNAEAVLRQMNSASNVTNIVILDACRDNPFVSIRSLDDPGLAEMRAPTGTFLAYSTAPGEVALDGVDGNSPFTAALAERIPEPGVPIEQLFKSVRNAVLQATNGAQTPWDTSSLTRNFTFVAAPAPSAAAQPRVPADAEREMFAKAQAEGTIEGYSAYLGSYPTGIYAEIASLELAILRAQKAKAALTPQPEAPAVAAAPEAHQSLPEIAQPVTFTSTLTAGGEGVTGRSLEEIIKGSPLFPPIEGLPDEVWKDKHCSDCHHWEAENLCTQAQTYTLASAARALSKEHPLGGGFKATLRKWAEGGCPQ
ncbi:caspase family protein [Oceaniglobus roseus]|uniref:caspase family protein n=1 Tax=Oceaniglobus roseus TaxID=1737570 RepID=UPI000C7F7016|nr:caspase family protein [Kandeliimicrobium roseum]